MGNNPQAEALVRLFKNNSDLANRKRNPNHTFINIIMVIQKKDYGGLKNQMKKSFLKSEV